MFRLFNLCSFRFTLIHIKGDHEGIVQKLPGGSSSAGKSGLTVGQSNFPAGTNIQSGQTHGGHFRNIDELELEDDRVSQMMSEDWQQEQQRINNFCK